MFTMGMNTMMTSHGLLPRAVQIFAHIMMPMMRFTKEKKNKIKKGEG